MTIKDKVLRDYSIACEYNSFKLREPGPNGNGEKTINEFRTLQEALQDIAKRQVAALDGNVTISEFHRKAEAIFEAIQNSVKPEPVQTQTGNPQIKEVESVPA